VPNVVLDSFNKEPYAVIAKAFKKETGGSLVTTMKGHQNKIDKNSENSENNLDIYRESY
jgi:hypothetical protein